MEQSKGVTAGVGGDLVEETIAKTSKYPWRFEAVAACEHNRHAACPEGCVNEIVGTGVVLEGDISVWDPK